MPEHEPTTQPPEFLNIQTPPLSKNALKRELKRQRWEDSKEERRAHKKAKIQRKKQEMKLSGQKHAKRPKHVEGQESSGIRVVVDCSFDNLMNERVCSASAVANE